tara:strand:- start:40234 stop:40899 length:666 start_codon:yes stop_codon:yes gene_type:complete
MINNDYFAFKLRNLYASDKQLFYQIADFMPNLVYINGRTTKEYMYTNGKSLKSPEIDMLFDKGGSYLPEISCPILFKSAILKRTQFCKENDFDRSLPFFQGIKMYNQMTYIYTSKLLLDDNLFFNISNKVNELGEFGKRISSVFDVLLKDLVAWQRFQALTKQEKIIIKLLSKGYLNKNVGELLFITESTVKTHRKNIYKKLDIHSLSELINVSIVLDFLA